MDERLELHEILCEILGSDNVYFQPPEKLIMKFPCIVYERSSAKTIFADNNPYNYKKRYKVTIIDPDPDSPIPLKVAKLPMCTFDTHFTADNLNHDVYSLYH